MSGEKRVSLRHYVAIAVFLVVAFGMHFYSEAQSGERREELVEFGFMWECTKTQTSDECRNMLP